MRAKTAILTIAAAAVLSMAAIQLVADRAGPVDTTVARSDGSG